MVCGDELRFAPKAMDQLQPALAALLDVSVGTVSRWEAGAEPIQRQIQLDAPRLAVVQGEAPSRRAMNATGVTPTSSRNSAIRCA